MHCFRGTLKVGGRPRPGPARAFVQFREAAGGGGAGWYGYLLVGSEGEVEPGGPYTLHLEDGRAGAIRVDAVTPEGSGRYRAVFVGVGPLG
jgi:hypothetical protein